MLLANRKVAELFGKGGDKKGPRLFVYRIHDRPDAEKLRISIISSISSDMGFKRSRPGGWPNR